jgi:hypothetical protein
MRSKETKPKSFLLILFTATLFFSSLVQTSAADDPDLLPGWPKVTGDDVHSSPALGDLDPNYPGLEVVVGSGDNKVYAWHSDGTDVTGWPKVTGSWVDSSPALGDLDPNYPGLEVVVGSRDGKVYAWHSDGTDVSGWPKVTGDFVLSSPALGDLDPNYPGLEVVVGSFDNKVYAWHRDGTNVHGWPKVTGSGVRPSPALGDLDPSYPGLEVVVGSSHLEVFVWYGDGTDVSGWPKMGSGTSSPALSDLDGNGTLEIVIGSFDAQVYVWTLPYVTYDTNPWPMFRHDPEHTGLYTPPVPAPPSLVSLMNGLGSQPDTFISPKADYLAVDSFEIEASEPVELLSGSAVSTDGTNPLVVSLDDLGSNHYRVRMASPLPVGHWTKITLDVRSEATGSQAVFIMWMGRLPNDIDQNGVSDSSDVWAFLSEWNGLRRPELLDLNGDGAANFSDAGTFSTQWNGIPPATQVWNQKSLPPKP